MMIDIVPVLSLAGIAGMAGAAIGILGYLEKIKDPKAKFSWKKFALTVALNAVGGAVGGALTQDVGAAVAAGVLGERAIKVGTSMAGVGLPGRNG